MVDGQFNKDKMLEKLPADIPDREKKVEAITKCSEESKFFLCSWYHCRFFKVGGFGTLKNVQSSIIFFHNLYRILQ